MARIDSILALVDRQGANELRLGSEREPQMFADGAPKRLAMSRTTTENLRELLGELLPPERERMVATQGMVQFVHESPTLGPFRVALTRRGPPGAELELDIVFLRGRIRGAVGEPPRLPPPLPPPAAPPRAPLPTLGLSSSDAPPSTQGYPQLPGEAPSPELAALLGRAMALRASDVHLLDGDAPVLRLDGVLRSIAGEPPADVLRLLGPGLAAEAGRRLATGASADSSGSACRASGASASTCT